MAIRPAFCVFLGIFMGMAAATASASSGAGISWSFQSTGYNTPTAVTALAMRDGLTWPVIFANSNGYIDAISLYPVVNASTGKYWHEIGNSLLPFYSSNPLFRAASSPTGEFAAVSHDYLPPGYAIIGSSQKGFKYVTGSSVHGVDYDMNGNLVTLTPNTLSLPSDHILLDIDSSIPGTIGVISRQSNKTYYHQTSPLLGGWATYEVPILGYAKDLALDSTGNPHIALYSYGGLIVKDFDVMSGDWTATSLDTISYTSEFSATMAADSRGGVGLAWVGSDGALKYSYKNGNDPWETHIVAVGVQDPNSPTEIIDISQTPGLAFDANDFPVISFVSDQGNIWLAYDPPAPAPEPTSILLLVSGLLTVFVLRRQNA